MRSLGIWCISNWTRLMSKINSRLQFLEFRLLDSLTRVVWWWLRIYTGCTYSPGQRKTHDKSTDSSNFVSVQGWMNLVPRQWLRNRLRSIPCATTDGHLIPEELTTHSMPGEHAVPGVMTVVSVTVICGRCGLEDIAPPLEVSFP